MEDHIDERIEAYLRCKMSDEDMEIFEAELKSDNALAVAFKGQQELHQMLEVLAKKNLKEKFRKWDAQADVQAREQEQPTSASSGFWDKLKVQAVQLQEILNHILTGKYDARIRLDNLVRTSKIRNSSNWTLIDEALHNLEQKQYKSAIENLTSFFQSAPADQMLKAKYYLGLAYYQLQEFGKAIPFLKIIAEEEYMHKHHAQWILSLAYLQVGELDSAKSLFTLIYTSKSPYGEDAYKLLKDLDKLDDID